MSFKQDQHSPQVSRVGFDDRPGRAAPHTYTFSALSYRKLIGRQRIGARWPRAASLQARRCYLALALGNVSLQVPGSLVDWMLRVVAVARSVYLRSRRQ